MPNKSPPTDWSTAEMGAPLSGECTGTAATVSKLEHGLNAKSAIDNK